jgi:predicted nucleotidyltransferase
MASVLTEFVESLKKVSGTNLRSIVLFGSRASNEEEGSGSDYNILIITEKVSIGYLDAVSALVDKWIKKGNHAPMIFTAEEFEHSSDVFPIEFLDMKSNHRVLAGSDPFLNIVVQDWHLRHECEYELRSKLLKLRQSYMVALGNKLALRSLLVSSVSSFIVLFRYALKIAGENVTGDKQEALKQASVRFGISVETFEQAMKLRRGQLDLAPVELGDLLAKYMADIEKVIAVVDSFE